MMKKAFLSLIRKNKSAIKAGALLPIALAGFTSRAQAYSVEVSEAPTTDLNLIVSAIKSAESSLFVNIYELSSPQIADAIIERIHAGVQVEILEEGQPVGGLSAASKGIETQIAAEMSSDDHFYEMTSHVTSTPSKRRFHYDHGKYIVVDEKSLVIGSENYSPTGNAVPGTLGNRGWEVFIHDTPLANEFQNTFVSDTSTQFGDILEITTGNPPPAKVTATATSDIAPSPSPLLDASAVDSFMSPTTSQDGLLALINGAQTSLDIEQMTFNSTWGKSTGNSPLYDAVIAAAKRGVAVRILLNDERVFDHPSTPSKPVNRLTFANLNALAQSQNLPLTVRIANIKAMGVDYIHNKGALVDGQKTLISSINWDWNSITNNRETAVVITGETINEHYSELFTQDWDNSATASNDVTSTTEIEELPAFTPKADSTCPASFDLRVQIGSLNVSDSQDPDFQSLANSTVSGSFAKNTSQAGCVLTQSDATGTAIAAQRFMEVRTEKDGSRMVILEGYTPTSQKLYSIRARISADVSTLGGVWNALVYDASGAAKASLGQASMVISISQQ